jgi:hypothetical protein
MNKERKKKPSPRHALKVTTLKLGTTPSAMRAFLESRAMDTKIDESQAIYRETIVAMYRF